MNNIKTIIRNGLPETNSSSSHAVSIVLDKNTSVKNNPEQWGFDDEVNIKNDTLYVNVIPDFGWEFFKSNTVKVKLLYLISAYLIQNSCGQGFSASFQKTSKRLKILLKDIFKVSNVIFLWETRFLNKEYDDLLYYDYLTPAVDHNSSDIFPDILESRETIEGFLFNKDSWIFGGNDNSNISYVTFAKEMYDETDKCNYILGSVDFGGEIGRIDFKISETNPAVFPKILYDLVYNRLINEVQLKPQSNINQTYSSLSSYRYRFNDARKNKNEDVLKIVPCFFIDSGKYYICFDSLPILLPGELFRHGYGLSSNSDNIKKFEVTFKLEIN